MNNEGGRTLKIERKRGRKVRDWGRDHAEQAESQPRRVVEDQRVFDERSSLTIDGAQGERSERKGASVGVFPLQGLASEKHRVPAAARSGARGVRA